MMRDILWPNTILYFVWTTVKTSDMCCLYMAVRVSFAKSLKYKYLQPSVSSFPVMHKALGRRSYCLLCGQNCKAKPQSKKLCFNLFILPSQSPS